MSIASVFSLSTSKSLRACSASDKHLTTFLWVLCSSAIRLEACPPILQENGLRVFLTSKKRITDVKGGGGYPLLDEVVHILSRGNLDNVFLQVYLPVDGVVHILSRGNLHDHEVLLDVYLHVDGVVHILSRGNLHDHEVLLDV